jgi:hypothetical protein
VLESWAIEIAATVGVVVVAVVLLAALDYSN